MISFTWSQATKTIMKNCVIKAGFEHQKSESNDVSNDNDDDDTINEDIDI